jgi:hypothetical protein
VPSSPPSTAKGSHRAATAEDGRPLLSDAPTANRRLGRASPHRRRSPIRQSCVCSAESSDPVMKPCSTSLTKQVWPRRGHRSNTCRLVHQSDRCQSLLVTQGIMNKVDYLRHRAEELRAEAATTRDPKRKRELRELGRALEQMAPSTQERRLITGKASESPRARKHYARRRSDPA